MSLFDKLKRKNDEQELYGKYAPTTSTNSKEMAYGYEYGHRIVFIEEHKYEPLWDYRIRVMTSCLTWQKGGLMPAKGREKDIARSYVVASMMSAKTEEDKKSLEEWKRLYALTDEDIKDAAKEIAKNLKLINGIFYICLDTLE